MDELVLVTSMGGWGDEMDLEGFAIYAKERWEKVKEGIPSEDFEAYYGSNEFVTFEGKEDYLSYIKEQPISYEKARELCSLLRISDNLLNENWLKRYNISYGLFVIKSENE